MAQSTQMDRIDESINSVIQNNTVKRRDPIPHCPRLFPCGRRDAKNDRLRALRGKDILRLFKQHPILVNSAQSRKLSTNATRNQIWREITSQINEKYGKELENITVAAAKKLIEYWKGRIVATPDRETPSPTTLSSEEETVERKPSIVVSRVKEQRLAYIIKQVSAQIESIESAERNRSRTPETNASRNEVWKRITDDVNEKFGACLDSLLVDQVKKAFSNYRRRHPKIDESREENLRPELSKDEKIANLEEKVAEQDKIIVDQHEKILFAIKLLLLP